MASTSGVGAKIWGLPFFVDMHSQLSHWDFRLLLRKTSLDRIDDRLKRTQVPQHHQAVLPEGGRGRADV